RREARHDRHDQDRAERGRVVGGELEDARAARRVRTHDVALDRHDVADVRARVAPPDDRRRDAARDGGERREQDGGAEEPPHCGAVIGTTSRTTPCRSSVSSSSTVGYVPAGKYT